jgi:hypothetical protein
MFFDPNLEFFVINGHKRIPTSSSLPRNESIWHTAILKFSIYKALERRMAKGEGREELIIATIWTYASDKKKQCCGSGSGSEILDYGSADRIRKKYLRIHNTVRKLDSPTLDLAEGPKRKSVAFLPVAEEEVA